MSRNFLKALLTVLVIVAFAGVSFAQDDANIIRPSTKQGSAAWMFEFGGLSSLGMSSMPISGTIAGNGANVAGAGFKTYLSDDLALRAILGLSIASSGDADKGTALSSTAFGVAVGVEMHTHAVYSTSPYFGAQLAFGSSSSTSKTGSAETKNSGSTFGIGVLAGFDWYFTHAIAVGGEYNLGFASAGASTTPPGGSATDAPSASVIGISSGSVHLIVHF